MITEPFKLDTDIIDRIPWWNSDLDDLLWFNCTKRDHKETIKQVLTEYRDLIEEMKYV
jgi:hypothetical protein